MTAKMQAKPRYEVQYRNEGHLYVPTSLELFVENVATKLNRVLSYAKVSDQYGLESKRKNHNGVISYKRQLTINNQTDDKDIRELLNNASYFVIEEATIGLVTLQYVPTQNGWHIKGLLEYPTRKDERSEIKKLFDSNSLGVAMEGISFFVRYDPKKVKNQYLDTILDGVVAQSGITARR
jgi:hypothetical protein